MEIYAAIVLTLMVLSTMLKADEGWPVAIGFAIHLPIFGRIFGWW
jgi:hypothetical protein